MQTIEERKELMRKIKDEVVALITTAKEETEEVAAPTDLSAIEISEERGKKEEEAPAEGETE